MTSTCQQGADGITIGSLQPIIRLALSTLILAACGSSSPDHGPDAGTGSGSGTGTDGGVDAPTNPAQRYEPWRVGATWSYKFTDPTGVKPAATGRKTTIGAQEDVGGLHAGQLAYKAHVETLGGAKDVWETPMGDLDVRYKTAYYGATGALTETDVEQPSRLKLDESVAHTATGAMFTETFMENVVKTGTAPTTKSETLAWKVISTSESVTVIAGTYTNVLHVQRFNAAKAETVDYWYARGVGKLKETGGNNDEELEAFTPGP